MKSVSFDEHCKVETFSKLQGDEIDQVWWSAYDYVRIKKDADGVVARLARGDITDLAGKSTFRGLENWCRHTRRERRKRVQTAIDAVLTEQDMQRRYDIFDPAAIAGQYAMYTMQDRETAAARGLADEETCMRECYDKYDLHGTGRKEENSRRRALRLLRSSLSHLSGGSSPR